MHGWEGRVSQIFFYKEKEKKLAERWGEGRKRYGPGDRREKREKNEVKAILQNDWRNVLTRQSYTHFTPKKLCLSDVIGRKGSLSFVG